jgi:GMP synthase-like glutamine amidotransferase
MTVYHASQGHLPDSIDDYQGVIIPGSFSSAYDTDLWIQELSQFIQTRLVPSQKPTLGVCFGHQLYANSFPTGGAVKCPAGIQAGRKQFQATDAGQRLLQQANVDLYYSHGDMVETLPECALSLGGNDQVPIQGAVYFATPQDAANFLNRELLSSSSSSSSNSSRPMAITFQAHPEFASQPLGVEKTMHQILDGMEYRGDMSEQDRLLVGKDAEENYAKVERQSLDTMKNVCRLLGWVSVSERETEAT